MSSLVTSKNVNGFRLIWPTLYGLIVWNVQIFP